MSRLGIYAAKIEAIRDQRGLTPAGFRQDGTDMAGTEKQAMLRDLYEHADSHLPSGLGGPVPSTDEDPANAGDEPEEGD